METIPTPTEIMSASRPLALRDYEHADAFDVVRFLYALDDSSGKPVETIEIMFRHRQTGDRTGLRFHGVKLDGLFPISPRDDAKLVVVNNALSRSKRVEPRMLEVRYEVCDGVSEVLFRAGGVESI
jgi:hypothetical protein